MKRIGQLTVGLVLLLAGKSQAATTELVVSAAASFQNAMREIGRDYQRSRPEVRLRFNFGSSLTLQRQIFQGAPVDVFVSASMLNMEDLAAAGRVDWAGHRVLANNRLVLIVPKNSVLPLKRFKDAVSPQVVHVAVGASGVPAGECAEEVFTKLGIWPQVLAKAVRAKDVRGVLTQVELGNVEAGVVYRTDALISDKVRVISMAPTSMHTPIRYPIGVLLDSAHPKQARDFLRFCTSAPAKRVLKKYGFIVP